MTTILLVLLINAAILIYPSAAVSSARDGLLLWFNSVLPALLPFAVMIGVLNALGFTRFLGVLLEPVMRAVFRLPGVAGFAFVMGCMAGAPMGAKLTAELRADGAISKNEARRLSAFSGCAGPLFVVGAVGVGVFESAWVGYFVYMAHILGALAVGVLLRGFGKKETAAHADRQRILTIASAKMDAERAKHGGFGQILGRSVMSSMETMLLVGGFIVIFSVIIGLVFRIFDGYAGALPDGNIAKAVFAGFIEISSGTRGLSEAEGRIALVAAAGIVSWGGLCIHAQSAAFLGKTDAGSGIYILGKTLHAAFAVGFALLLYPLFVMISERRGGVVQAAAREVTVIPNLSMPPVWQSVILFAVSFVALVVVSLVVYLITKPRKGVTR